MAALKLYRPREVPGHLVGEDKAGKFLLFPAEPGGWLRRTSYDGPLRESEAVPSTEGRGTKWPGAIGGKARDGKPSTHQIGVRINDDERKAWEKAAAGRPLADWIRLTCNAAAPPTKLRSKPKP